MAVTRAQRRAEWVTRNRGAAATIPPASRPASRSSVHLRIEELVLDGFPVSAGYPIGEGLQQELTRLFGERGVPSHMIAPREAARIDAGSFQASAGAPPAITGAQIAVAVYGGPKR
jgi:hypothetical protein